MMGTKRAYPKIVAPQRNAAYENYDDLADAAEAKAKPLYQELEKARAENNLSEYDRLDEKLKGLMEVVSRYRSYAKAYYGPGAKKR
jgi:hypothetical protein